ncbi:hypothetical protein VTL71DRAFT_9533 [Oculimacula yallundae]|uniref:Polyketide synthase n=1 Tax=Oculimacula yallundae TaxID=86028 RepID=A0ABR4BS55_9HELO
MERNYGDALEPIAVVGMACRFAGEASSVDKLWEMMMNGRHAASDIPEDRFNADAWYHPSPERKGAISTKRGFFLKEDVSLFDAPFFSMAANEVVGMDPMQRQLLELAYESFENAGMSLQDLIGSHTAVYSGVMTNDYELISASDTYHLPLNSASGTGRAMLSNRLSWFFDLRGPSLTLDTACSSSLYALHLACQALRQGEASQALVTGVNLILHPSLMSQLSSMHMISVDGTSHSFDISANGYGRGEGVGGIVIKPLSAALADGDTIRAVIRGSGVNQDGKTPGITMPSEQAQADLISATYLAAGLTFEDTSYFEAHGTGTALGQDPVEMRAVAATIGKTRKHHSTPLYVGSVKTNIGHTEGMAGLAGVIKTILCLEKGVLTPVVGFKTLNPKLHFSDWHMALPLETMAWPTPGLRRGSVNSFGFGGSNAHVILDDALHYLHSRGLSGNHITAADRCSSGSANPPAALSNGHFSHEQLFVFSSSDKAGLHRVAEAYKGSFLPETVRLDFLSYTLSSRRTHFDYRSFVVADSQPSLMRALARGLPSFSRRSGLGMPALVFTGQGAQWVGMGRELISHAIYRESVLKSQHALRSFGCDWDALDMLSGSRVSSFDRPSISQPICTILQIALVDMLFAWGLVPGAVVGHSSGEIVAAYAAGAISQHDALKVAYYRGIHSEEIPRRLKHLEGAMMAAGISEEEACSYLKHEVVNNEVVIGCINSPFSVTLSGERKAIERLELILQRDGKFARRLRVDVAYHSPQMQVVAADFLESIGEITTAPSFRYPMFSSVTTKRVPHPQDLGPSYWVRNMLGSVKFAGAVKNMICSPASRGNGGKRNEHWAVLLEVGPAKTLKGPLDQILAALDSSFSEKISYTSILQYQKSAVTTAFEAMGHLWCSGCSIDLVKVNNNNVLANVLKPQALTMLPSYPWNHKTRFWHEPEANRSARHKRWPRTDLLGMPYENQNPFEPQWRNVLGIRENPWLKDHIITETCLYPGAGILIMVLEAACQMADPQSIAGVDFEDVFFERGLVIPAEDSAVEVSLNIKPHESIPSRYCFAVYSMPKGAGWTKHAHGMFLLRLPPANENDLVASQSEWAFLKSQHADLTQLPSKPVDAANFYQELKAAGLEYGPLFTNLDEAVSFDGVRSASGRVLVPDTRSSMPSEFEFPHYIHPATLDAMFHLVYVALSGGARMAEAAIPVQIDRAFISTSLPSGAGAKYTGFSHATSTKDGGCADLLFSDEQWTGPKVHFQGIRLQSVSSEKSNHSKATPTSERERPSRTAQIQWLEDVDFFQGPLAAARIKEEAYTAHTKCLGVGAKYTIEACVAWLRRMCHKHADLSVLVAMGVAGGQEILQRYAPDQKNNSSETFRFKSCTVFNSSERNLDILKKSLVERNITCRYSRSLTSEVLDSYDLVICDVDTVERENGWLDTLRLLLRKGGSLACLGQRSSLGSPVEKKLLSTGFNGISLQIQDDKDAFIVTRLDEKHNDTPHIAEVYLLQPTIVSSLIQDLMSNLQEQLKLMEITTRVICLDQVSDLKDKTVISLLEIEQPFVLTWTGNELEHFRMLVSSAECVLWVSRGGFLSPDIQSLHFAPTTGLLRTIRVEYSSTTLPHLDLSRDLGSEHAASVICKLLQSTSASPLKNNETEYIELAGHLHIPRLTKSSYLDRFLAMPPNSKQLDYRHGDDPRKELVDLGPDIDTFDSIEDDEVVICSSFTTPNTLGPQVSAPALFDTLVGKVSKIGLMVLDLQLGQNVIVFGPKAVKGHIKVRHAQVCPLPSSFNAAFGAYISLGMASAWHVLFHVTRLKRGDHVLIHVKSKQLSRFLALIAHHLGAVIFLVVDSVEDEDFWQAMGDVAPTTILDSESSILQQHVLRATGSVGVHFLITTCHGLPLNRLASCITEDGHLVDLGQNIQAADFPRTFFQRNINFSSVDLMKLKSATLCKLFTEASQHLDIGLFHRLPKPVVKNITEMDVFLQGGPEGNASVFSFEEPAIPTPDSLTPSTSTGMLNSQGTYILSGGLGALGLAIADDLINYGARHLVFLSRSGPTSLVQKATLQSFRARGCKIDSLKCDISNAEEVERAMMLCKDNDWRVTGVLQCAMVLQDAIFENMTIESWRQAIDPKIKGSWNLHLHAPAAHLEFFIILSSMSAVIGNSAQANYCAGNSYEDALAHYRQSLGLPATTLNVGLVTDASHFHSDYTIEDYLKKFGHLAPISVDIHELLSCLAIIMTRPAVVVQPLPPQLLIGVSDRIPRHRDLSYVWPNDRKFDHRVQDADEHDERRELDIETSLKESKSAAQALSVVENFLRRRVAASITALPEDIDVSRPLFSFGFDSLKAMETRNWIQSELKCGISVFDIMSPMSLTELALQMAAKSPFTPANLVPEVISLTAS